MTVYVDNWRQPARVGHVVDRWSHLVADTEDELHRFAVLLGMRREWFQPGEGHPYRGHYDLTDRLRDEAIELGATAITWRELGQMIRRFRDAVEGGRPAPRST